MNAESKPQSVRNFYVDEAGDGILFNVVPTTLSKCPELQVVDYFLWALQRLYERREDRYIVLLWPSVSVVYDLDDRREAPYGAYYTRKKPLTSAALEDLPGI